MKISDSKLRYEIEGYYSNTPFITKRGTYSKSATRNNNHEDMKDDTTRK